MKGTIVHTSLSVPRPSASAPANINRCNLVTSQVYPQYIAIVLRTTLEGYIDALNAGQLRLWLRLRLWLWA